MSEQHLVNHIKHPGLASGEILHVIGVVSNPIRWHSRYRLAREWIVEMEKTHNIKVYVVEADYKDRHFEVTDKCNPRHLQVHSHSEIWLKENLINLGVKHLLPKNWKYMAWVDMDVHFRDPNWATKALHALQHYHIIQPWSHATDLDFHGGIHGTYTSFGYLSAHGLPMWKSKDCPGYTYAHTGFAWACTRYFYENVEKLLDFCIIGASDHHQAWACINKVRWAIHQGMCDDYYRECEDWQRKAYRACSGVVGYSSGRIEHHFHGPKTKRFYWDRWNILIKNKFNPKTDLAYNGSGVLTLSGSNKYKLEHDIMRYNRSRCEDSIEQF